jgi:hypothetical protein
MNSFVTPPIALAIAAIWSSACAPTASSGCPPLVAYPPALAARLAEEIESMGPDMVTPDIVADYLVLREQVRICRQDGP